MTDTIDQLEAKFRTARDAAYAASIEISAREWEALKSQAARVADGRAYNASGREIGHAFVSKKYGLCCYRLTSEHAALTAAMNEVDARLTAAKKAAAYFRPTGADLEAQRRRSLLGTTRPTGSPRAAHMTKNG